MRFIASNFVDSLNQGIEELISIDGRVRAVLDREPSISPVRGLAVACHWIQSGQSKAARTPVEVADGAHR